MSKQIKKLLFSFVLLIAIGNIIAFFIEPSFIKQPVLFLKNSLFAIAVGFPLMKGNELIISYISKHFTWNKNPVLFIIYALGSVIVFTTVVTFIVNFLFTIFIYDQTVAYFWQSTLYIVQIEIFIVVYVFTIFTGIAFFKMWKEGLAKQESFQRREVELQLDALKNQVNPHFLFNSLNCLTSLVYKDQDLAAEFIAQLSNIYRYVLEQNTRKVVAWKTEQAFIENYIALQKIRFGDSLNVTIQPVNIAFFVVPLSVQMLVENAIKHNTVTADEPLSIEIFTSGDFLVVRNKLQPKKIIESSEHIGLNNIQLQYELLTKRKVEISETGGFFIVKLPFIIEN